MLKIVFLTVFFIAALTKSQVTDQNVYDHLKSKWDTLGKNDERAFLYINPYLHKAKDEQNYKKLVEGYREAVYYAKDNHQKLKYADSTLQAALKSKDEELITVAYLGKGIIYYSNFKKYESALSEYLKANEHSKNINDQYLKNKINYHLAVVKSYLGYYEEAQILLERSLLYFRNEMNKTTDANEKYNYTKGYLNALHQLTICMRQQHQYKISDSIIQVGLSASKGNPQYALEYAYFQKCKGISQLRQGNYPASITNLEKSIPEIKRNNDFAWLSAVYYFLGQNYMKLGETNKGLAYYQKVDSIFRIENFIFPEVGEVYHELTKFYLQEDKDKEVGYYAMQGAEVARFLKNDFTYLSSKVHQLYDNKNWEEAKNRVERKSYYKTVLISLLIAFLLMVLYVLYKLYKHLKKEKHISQQYEKLLKDLEKRGESPQTEQMNHEQAQIQERKLQFSADLEAEILVQLNEFEQDLTFLQKGLTLKKLAEKLNTNSSYLSYVINENKGLPFNSYLNQLRISYITQMLYTHTKYLNYTIETLASECGIASRQNFSDLFYELNGLRPIDFIRKRKKELDMK